MACSPRPAWVITMGWQQVVWVGPAYIGSQVSSSTSHRLGEAADVTAAVCRGTEAVKLGKNS